MPPNTTSFSTGLLRHKLFWVALLYFGEGAPLGAFYDLFPVYFRQQGVSLAQIGLISLLGLAWTLKFLWAPLVDWLRAHRRWIGAANLGMALVMLAFATSPGWGPWAWVAIGAFALLSATCDIATDGYTIEWLEPKELGLANGVRIGFYRVGMLMAGVLLALSTRYGWSLAFMLAALLHLGNGLVALLAPPLPHDKTPKEVTPATALPKSGPTQSLPAVQLWWLAVALILFALLWPVVTTLLPTLLGTQPGTSPPPWWRSWWFRALPPVGLLLAGAWVGMRAARAQRAMLAALRTNPTTSTTAQPLVTPSHSLFASLQDLLSRPYMLGVVAFILLYKVGDSSAGFMIKPFWVDAGFSAEQIGLVSVNLGLGLSIAGGVVGGWYVDRRGIWRALWVLGLWQALSNLGYTWAASVVPWQTVPPGSAAAPALGWDLPLAHQAMVYGASACESFTAGLGTAAFLAFLMRITDRTRAATQYAILSSIFAFSRSLAGGLGGLGAQALGYTWFFGLSFLLCFPAFFFLYAVRRQLERVEALALASTPTPAASHSTSASSSSSTTS